ncbi:Atg14 domain-containing protein [Tellurirhabdus bombi]|uniref:Atg14 domain-containing protein n=1 Tax=Tellurirhabdus bombi TaxID=2907205 RepID=UPI001F460652|nr:Atg14 domain-containing protein [Tellurirhabdus bombi]
MPEPEKNTDLEGFGKKILSFFIKEAPEQPKPAAAPSTAPPQNPGPVMPTNVPEPQPQSQSGTVAAKFIEHFGSVLERTNLKGPDYFEFREILSNLSNLGLSEEKQFQAAWASFRAMAGPAAGDVSVLTTAAGQYVAALNKDREEFLKSVDTAIAEKVGGLQNEQKNLKAQNEELARQIQELQQRMKANDERLSQINGEVDEQSHKITQNKQAYEMTFDTFVEQIKADILKIQTHLKS